MSGLRYLRDLQTGHISSSKPRGSRGRAMVGGFFGCFGNFASREETGIDVLKWDFHRSNDGQEKYMLNYSEEWAFPFKGQY